MESDLINIEEACELLGVSRPTFHQMRETLNLREYPFGKRTRFSQSEILEKVSKRKESITRKDAVSVVELNIDECAWESYRLNLDKLANLDAFYSSVLLCSALYKARSGIPVEIHSHLLLNAKYLTNQNLFVYLTKLGSDKISIDPRLHQASQNLFPEIILPITQIGFKSAEEKITKGLSPILKTHGFSEDIGGYISWALGELADNSHTHADTKGLCFISVERLVGEHKFLQINILDLGIGIQTTLKKKSAYSSLPDDIALLTAFKPNVSSWPDEAKRGKGLTDIFIIAMSCKAILRVESNDQAFIFNFQNLEKPMSKVKPSAYLPGTRFSITLVDDAFEDNIKRSDVSTFIDKCLEEL